MRITPLNGGLWEEGWVVKNVCDERQQKSTCNERQWISQGDLAQVYFKGGGKQFIDPHTSKRGILFNAAGAAKTAHGGFVANRLILGHDRDPELRSPRRRWRPGRRSARRVQGADRKPGDDAGLEGRAP